VRWAPRTPKDRLGPERLRFIRMPGASVTLRKKRSPTRPVSPHPGRWGKPDELSVGAGRVAGVGGGGPRRGDGSQLVHWGMAVTIYGVCAVTFMMTMYALERRRRAFILAFAGGCVLSSVYGFWSGAWPFGVVELVWSGIAVHRYLAGQPEPV